MSNHSLNIKSHESFIKSLSSSSNHITSSHLKLNAIYWALTSSFIMNKQTILDHELIILFLLECWEESKSMDEIINQSVGDQSVGDQSVGNQSLNDQSLMNQSLNNQSLNNQSLINQSLNNQSLNNQSLNNQSLMNQSLMNQSLNNQSVGNQSLMNQSLTNTLMNHTEQQINHSNHSNHSNQLIGGFAPNMNHDRNILATLSGIQILALLGRMSILDEIHIDCITKITKREMIRNYLQSLYHSDGYVVGDEWGERDSRYVSVRVTRFTTTPSLPNAPYLTQDSHMHTLLACTY